MAMTGAEALLGQIMANGVDTIFGLPGGQLDYFFDAMHNAGDTLRLFGTRHEQGAAYMAFGYARSTGKPGVYTVVPGPGVLNTTAALCSAYATNAPVFCLTGQIPTQGLGKGIGYLHELPDQLATMRTLTKWADRAMTPESAPALVNEGFRQMLSGRPRPVSLEMPMDVMAAQKDVALLPAATLDQRPALDEDAIADAVALLKNARNPLIIAGGGAIAAGPALEQLATMLQAPVVAFRSGRGVVSDRSPLSQMFPAGYELWKNADVVIGVGSRMEQQYLYWKVPAHMKVIRIDIDAEELDRIAAPAVSIHADAADAVPALVEKLSRVIDTRASRSDELTELAARIRRDVAERVQPQESYLAAIRAALPEDGYFVDEITQVGYTSWYSFPVYEPRHLITCGYQGTLGYGYATALGVKAAHPDKAVVNITGDGGFLFTANEMATAAQHNIALVTVLFNNNKFQNVQRQQKEWFDGRLIASDLKNPDFVKYAESFGIRAERVASPEALQAAVKAALERNEPALIEVPCGDMASPWPFIIRPPAFENA